MNEPKPEDVMRALECCQSATPIDCRICPYKDQTTPEYKSCCNLLVADALALLLEKDAEIERLKAENVVLENGLEISLHQQKQIEADTVRKMSERLRKESYPFPCAIGVEYAVPYCKVDQIAKEMLEEK